MLITFLLFTAAMAAIVWFRRHASPGERFQAELQHYFLPLYRSLAPRTQWDWALNVLLAAAVAAALGMLARPFASAKVGERFAEFYVLGPGGEAEGYPRQVILGEESRLRLGIVNSEFQNMDYRIEVAPGGQMVAQQGPLSLGHGEKWEQEVTFAPGEAGANQRVEFLLFKGEESQPYRTLHLWLDVMLPR